MTGFDLYPAFALVAVCAASLGYTVGSIVEGDRGLTRMAERCAEIEVSWQKWRHEFCDLRDRELAAGRELTEERDGLVIELAAKQRRVRGILTEARRWRAEAVARGWKRETRGEMHARWARESEES